MWWRFQKKLRFISRLIKCLLIPALIVGVTLFYIVSLQNTSYQGSDDAQESAEAVVGASLEETIEDVVAKVPISHTSGLEEDEPKEFQITVLDVGQASCSLIESNGEYMIFDGGDRSTSSKVVAVCKSKGISHIKYLVASHFHADHVYGLVGIIKSGITFDYLVVPDYETESYAKNALMPLVDDSKVLHPYPEQRFQIGDVVARCIGPVTAEYSDDNGYSVGFVFEYETLKVLIDGDATEEAEIDMLEAGIDVDADILVVPHHGSTYSSSAKWLGQVSPEVAIISCGRMNEYFHPHEGTLERLKECGIKDKELYRTDLQGDIVISMAGGNYTVTSEKEAEESLLWIPGEGKEKQPSKHSTLWDATNDKVESYYIGNKYSKAFHRPSCDRLPKEERRVIISDRGTALDNGYRPCGNCGP